MRAAILIMVAVLPAWAWASGVVKVYAASRHFGLEASTVMGLSSDGKAPDEKGWKKRTQPALQSSADQLEGALPRLKETLSAARALMPLDDPKGRRELLDLSGDKRNLVEVAFGEPVSAAEVDVLTRALAAELQVKRGARAGADVRRWVGSATFVIVVLSVLAGLWFGRKRVPAPRT